MIQMIYADIDIPTMVLYDHKRIDFFSNNKKVTWSPGQAFFCLYLQIWDENLNLSMAKKEDVATIYKVCFW